ncbi:EamA family transporter [Agromyces soli]
MAVLAVSSGAAPGAASAPGAGAVGLAASLGAGASYAVYTLAGKTLIDRGWRPESSMGALFGGAAAASLPLLLMTDASWLATPEGLAMALWLGLVTTTIAYLLFGYGLTGLLPATVSTLTLAEPLTAGLLAVAVLSESLSPGAWLGLAVLATGIGVLAASGRSRPEPAAAEPNAPESSAPESSDAHPAAAVSEGAPIVDAWTSSSSPASGSAPTRGGG